MATFYEGLRQNDRLFPLLRRPGITGGLRVLEPSERIQHNSRYLITA